MRKIISVLTITATLLGILPGVAFANVVSQDLIQTIDLAVSGGGTAANFQPGSGQSLTTSVDFNTESFGNQLANSSGYVVIKQGSTVIKTLTSWTNSNVTTLSVAVWNGREIDNTSSAQAICGTSGAVCPNGSYTVEAHVNYVSGSDTFLETQTANLTIGAPVTALAITNFVVTAPGGSLDPSPSGDNEDLSITYTLNQIPDQISAVIKDSNNSDVKTFVSSNISETFAWDGIFANKLVLPGTYSVNFTATKAGSANVTSSQNFTVAYNNTNKGDITDFNVIPNAFDPDTEDAIIEFKNTKDADLTVEIQNATNAEVRGFDDYDSDNYSENSSHSIAWNGKNNVGSIVSLGAYKVVVISRNEFGVVVKESTVTVNNSGGSVNESNNHISGISFSPSSKFEPAEDDELTIRFDVLMDLDELKIFAVRGEEKIELYSEEDVEEEDNLEITWDGTDGDDEYAAQGSWRIQFESKKDATSLIAAKSIPVQYKKPKIDDLLISKDKFDNEQNEFTYVLFRVDEDANVTIKVLESNDEDDDIVEDMEVIANKWYAVQWDGGSYEYDDDLDLKLIAENKVNEDVFESKKISVDLAEDEVSSSKSNITGDSIDPVVTNGNEEMSIYYNIEDEADTTVTIHRGQSGSGSVLIELLDITDQSAGDHTVTWNGQDDDGDRLSNGIYSYKIVSKTGSTDTEKGIFIVGAVGEVEGGGSGSSSVGSPNNDDDSDDNNSNVSPNVIIDGGNYNVPDYDAGPADAYYCAGFYDVYTSDKECEAVIWAKDRGIFQGYGDGTFGLFDSINRAEFLTVVLRTLGINGDSGVTGNLGFSDVVPGSWYIPYISAARNLGIFHGDSGKNQARPADNINRAEVVKMIFEGLGVISGGSFQTGCSQPYADVTASAWFYNYSCMANELGLFDTFGNSFNAGTLSNRGEIVMALYRLHLVGWL